MLGLTETHLMLWQWTWGMKLKHGRCPSTAACYRGRARLVSGKCEIFLAERCWLEKVKSKLCSEAIFKEYLI
jgi:hypothetical protein